MDFLDSNPKSFSGTVPPKPMPVDVLARRPSESGEVSSDAVSSSSRSLTTHVATDKLGGRGSSSREVVDISGQGDSPSLHAGAVGVGAKRIRPVDIDAGDDIVVKSGRREMTTARQTRPEEEIVDFSLGLPVNTLAEMAPVSMREPSQKTFKSQFKLPNNKKIAKEFDANVSLLDVYIIMAAEVILYMYVVLYLNFSIRSDMFWSSITVSLNRCLLQRSRLQGPDTSICSADSPSPRCSGRVGRPRREQLRPQKVQEAPALAPIATPRSPWLVSWRPSETRPPPAYSQAS
jgi:hypothetical protein